jgi:hypothetical protein
VKTKIKEVARGKRKQCNSSEEESRFGDRDVWMVYMHIYNSTSAYGK